MIIYSDRQRHKPRPGSCRQSTNYYELGLGLVKMLLVLLTVCNIAFGQSVITSDQKAKESDAEVVIPCDYSKFTNNPDTIDWKEVNEAGADIIESIVNDKKTEDGRYSLRTASGNADLIISGPMRNDSQRRFQCRIRNNKGDTQSSVPSVLTVYYLDDPVLKGPMSSIDEGDPVTLTCSIPDGKPASDVTWYKDGKTLGKKDVKINDKISTFSIKKSTREDRGKYTCKAESGQFKGNDAKTSNSYELILNYISINFEFEDNIATCTAEGHPKPFNVTIIKDGKVIKYGEDIATVEITDEMCNSNLTCSAGNGKIKKIEEVKNCGEQDSRFPAFVVIIGVSLLFVIWIFILIYCIYYKNIEWEVGEDVKSVEEGDDAFTMTWRYRPSVAKFKSFQVYKNDECGSPQQQFSSNALFFKYILYCSVYLCGFVCCEYCNKKKYAENPVKRNAIQEMGELGNGDGQNCDDSQKEANPSGDLKSSLLTNTLSTEAKWQVKRLDCTTGTANGRGKISFEISKPIKRSESGKYLCQIQSRRSYEHTKALHVNWLEMESIVYPPEENQAFEMKCRYGSPDMPLKNYKWKKIDADGNPLIKDLSKDPSFEVSKHEGSCTLTVRILKVKLSDAGTYQCSVGKKLTATIKDLDVKTAPFRMQFEDATSYRGSKRAKLVLHLIDKDQSTEVLNTTWFKEDDEKNPLASLKVPDKTSRYLTTFVRKNCQANLFITDVTLEDAGKYTCKVEVKGRQWLYICSGLLKIEDPVLHFTNKSCIAGEDVKIPYQLSPKEIQIKKLIFSKIKVDGTFKEVASSDDFFKITSKFEAHYDNEKKQGFLHISKVMSEDAGEYHCRCVINKNVNCSASWKLEVVEKEWMKMGDSYAKEGQNAVLVCVYKIEGELKAVKWYKNTPKGKQLISAAERGEINQKQETKDRFIIKYTTGGTRMEIKSVSVKDSGKYNCQLERNSVTDRLSKFDKNMAVSAMLCVPWTVFDKKTNRHPAIVFMNSHFLVFCEHNDSAVLRRGKLTITNSIDWEKPQTLIKENTASFQNIVPIVVDKEKGHVILMCVMQSMRKRKLIMKRSYDNGKTWRERNDVKLKMENFDTDLLKKCYIGPGHGVCLQSGKLVVSGVSEQETDRNVLFLLTSEDSGESWEVELAPNPRNAFLGFHSQITEYANDHVCITCSLKDSKQRFHVFSNDGFKTFDRALLESTLIEANPCQAGIISVPLKSDAGYNLTAFTNPSSSEKFENLTVHLSEDGCETWTKFSELGSAYTKDSDLAYYEVKDGNRSSKGLACVYETGSSEEDCSIVMQLVSLDKRN